MSILKSPVKVSSSLILNRCSLSGLMLLCVLVALTAVCIVFCVALHLLAYLQDCGLLEGGGTGSNIFFVSLFKCVV